ncbi:predicted protein [Enterococcus faecalis T11]|nr:predicted protein [Enterococcus faecalis T11]
MLFISYEIEKNKITYKLPRQCMNKKQVCDYIQASNNTPILWVRVGLPKIKKNGTIRPNRIAINNWL